MTLKSYILASAMVVGLCTSANAASLDNSEMIKLQVDMQSFIDSNSVDGALLGLDLTKGGVASYVPTKAHPKIMTMGDYIVMCADVVDADGKTVMANFYMAKSGNRHIVFQATYGDDPYLMSEMKAGRLVMAN